MKIYELITPNDPVTFLAESDKIAFIVCMLMAEGRAGCQREDGECINTLLAFIPKPQKAEVIKQYCGTTDIEKCLTENLKPLAESLRSFSSGYINERKMPALRQYADGSLAIKSNWLKVAWNLGEQIHDLWEQSKIERKPCYV